MRLRGLILFVIATTAAFAVPPSLAATSHRFKATYTGQAAGQANGSEASGTATATGRGKLIGASTLHASGHGVVSGECIDFTGTALLKGRAGSAQARRSAEDTRAPARRTERRFRAARR